jgi:AmiR/NasT family two-component response regulator
VVNSLAMQQGKNIQRIRAAVADGRLREPFSPSDVNRVLGIAYASTFLPTTELLEHVSHDPALYRLTANCVSRDRLGCGSRLF